MDKTCMKLFETTASYCRRMAAPDMVSSSIKAVLQTVLHTKLKVLSHCHCHCHWQYCHHADQRLEHAGSLPSFAGCMRYPHSAGHRS